jgi:hypothetical protein
MAANFMADFKILLQRHRQSTGSDGETPQVCLIGYTAFTGNGMDNPPNCMDN